MATVEISAHRYKEALAIRADEYEVLWEAARSCVWLGTYGPEDQRTDSVTQGLWWAGGIAQGRGAPALKCSPSHPGRSASTPRGVTGVRAVSQRIRANGLAVFTHLSHIPYGKENTPCAH